MKKVTMMTVSDNATESHISQENEDYVSSSVLG